MSFTGAAQVAGVVGRPIRRVASRASFCPRSMRAAAVGGIRNWIGLKSGSGTNAPIRESTGCTPISALRTVVEWTTSGV